MIFMQIGPDTFFPRSRDPPDRARRGVCCQRGEHGQHRVNLAYWSYAAGPPSQMGCRLTMAMGPGSRLQPWREW